MGDSYLRVLGRLARAADALRPGWALWGRGYGEIRDAALRRTGGRL